MKKIGSLLMIVVLTIALTVVTTENLFAQWDQWKPGQPMPPKMPRDSKEPAPPSPEERFEMERRPRIESFYAEPTPINYGSEVTLKWRFKSPTDDIRALTTTIVGIHEHSRRISIAVGPEKWRVVSRSTSPLVHHILEGSYTFRPQWKGGYSDFRLTIQHGGKTYTKETGGRGVQVNYYKLEMKTETIQSPQPTVRFYVENKDWGHYSGPYIGRLRVIYSIISHPSGQLNKRGTHDFDNVNLTPGIKTSTVEIPLVRDEAFSSNEIKIQYQLVWVSPYPGEGEQSTRSESSHLWAESPGRLDRMILFGLNAYLSTLKFRLHNDDGVQASFVHLPPFTVPITGRTIPEIRVPFPIPEMQIPLLGLFGERWATYRSWIRDINNAPIGMDTISIKDGGITLDVPIEAGGPTEIRCVYDPLGVGGYTDDYACPDIDLRGPINLKITFMPAVVDGKIGYSSANVDLTIGDTTFPGAWDWFIELFTGDLKPKIESESEKTLKILLERRDVRENIRDMLWNGLREAMPTITRITRVEIRGNELLFWYL